MARISTYPNDTDVVGGDKWIGSDSQNHFQTKKLTAQSVANFINKTAAESQLLRYHTLILHQVALIHDQMNL